MLLLMACVVVVVGCQWWVGRSWRPGPDASTILSPWPRRISVYVVRYVVFVCMFTHAVINVSNAVHGIGRVIVSLFLADRAPTWRVGYNRVHPKCLGGAHIQSPRIIGCIAYCARAPFVSSKGIVQSQGPRPAGLYKGRGGD